MAITDKARQLAQLLDSIPDEVIADQYADPINGTLIALARMYGCSTSAIWARLNRSESILTRANALRARRLHEYAIEAIYATPEYIADQNGNMRIDPSSVTLLRYRADIASRVAGILDAKLSERTQLDVTVKASPLADAIREIAAHGSSVPIAPCIIDGRAREVVDAVEVDSARDAIDLE
jgi:hypothetical protein